MSTKKQSGEAAQLLAAACILESLPSIKQKGEYVEHAVRTVLGMKDATLCLKACGGPAGVRPECGACDISDSNDDGQWRCPLTSDSRFHVLPVGSASPCPGVLALAKPAGGVPSGTLDLLSNFLTLLAVSIEKNLELRFQKTVSDILSRFVVITDVGLDEALYRSLSELGELFDADRSYLFRLSDDLTLMDKTHEWCAPGVEPQKENLQQIQTDSGPWWMDSLRSMRPINIPDVEKMPPEAEAEQKILKARDIQSLLTLPVIGDRGQPIGFIGLDLVRKRRFWSDDEIRMLQLVAGIISSALLRNKIHEELMARLDELERWRKVMLDRESRVIELKREVNEACRRAGAPPPYACVEEKEFAT